MTLTQTQHDVLIQTLAMRFEKNMHLHDGFIWQDILDKLLTKPDKLMSLFLMEETGGEPDVVDFDRETQEYVFMDCAPETPKGRRSLCYDDEALASRKVHKPKDSAQNMAAAMGITLLTEKQYQMLQSLGSFDQKTSSWLQTPQDIRTLGGALFGDRRYNTVFLYHNGAESYYASRGFRGLLKV